MIDYHTKYAWAVSLPNKCGTKKHKFLKLLLAYWERRKINKVWSDSGKEFFNKTYLKFFEQNEIQICPTISEL